MYSVLDFLQDRVHASRSQSEAGGLLEHAKPETKTLHHAFRGGPFQKVSGANRAQNTGSRDDAGLSEGEEGVALEGTVGLGARGSKQKTGRGTRQQSTKERKGGGTQNLERAIKLALNLDRTTTGVERRAETMSQDPGGLRSVWGRGTAENVGEGGWREGWE